MEYCSKRGETISKALPCPVLSTEYFADAYVAFTVYYNGRRIARHVPAECEGFPRSPGKSKTWSEQLGLSQETEKILQIVFKETSPEVSLRLMECVLDCPLWVDTEFIDVTPAPTQEYLTEYIERKRAEKGIKNRTKLILRDEAEGNFSGFVIYPAVREEHKNGRKSFWTIQDGALRKLFEKEISGWVVRFLAEDRERDTFLLTFSGMYQGKTQEVACVFSNEGDVLGTFTDNEGRLLCGSFLDRDRIFLDGGCYNIRTHQKEWNLGIGKTAYGIHSPCRLDNGRLAVVYDTESQPLNSYFMSFQPDGSEKIVLKLSQFNHWAYPVAYNNEFLLACGSVLTAYDSFLKEQWSMDLGENVGQLGRPLLDAEEKMLYMSTYRRITAFDLEKREITAVRNVSDGENCYLYDVLPGEGSIMLTGGSSIQVWNSELTPISRHKTKGEIGQILHQDEKTYILTNARNENNVIVKIRLYELTV